MALPVSEFPIGSLWKRSEIHQRLGGNTQRGISSAAGKPYLESHYITQLADDGPDAPRDVVAACPTCHRRIHNGADGAARNKAAHERIRRVEAAIDEKCFKVVTAAVIRDDSGRVLIAQRKQDQQLGSKWESGVINTLRDEGFKGRVRIRAFVDDQADRHYRARKVYKTKV